MRNLLALGTLLLAAGCATSGPHHIYTTQHASDSVRDLTAGVAIDHLIHPGEHVAGLAYDFNTDHLFLRITPRQLIRVVERPSGKILREMPLPTELRSEASSADLAIRSSDRHLFAVNADRRSLTELSLFGKPLRTISLTGLDGNIDGLAFDQKHGLLLVLTGQTVSAFDTQGNLRTQITLSAPANAVSLGYDSDAQHCLVPLRDGTSLGEFDTSGKLIKTHTSQNRHPITAVDAGARSFVRVF